MTAPECGHGRVDRHNHPISGRIDVYSLTVVEWPGALLPLMLPLTLCLLLALSYTG